MNICLVSGEYPPENGWGGIATYTYYMARALTRLGHRVFVVAAEAAGAPKEIVQDGTTVFRINQGQLHYYLHRMGLAGGACRLIKRLEYQIAVVRQVRAIEKRFGLDITEYADSYADGLLHRQFCRCAYVVRLHAPYYVLHQYGHQSQLFMASMERAQLRRANGISSPSRAISDDVADHDSVAKSSIRVIHNPIDVTEFVPAKRTPAKRPMVLYMGWITSRKGIETLLNAIPIVKQSIPEVEFLFVGNLGSASNLLDEFELLRKANNLTWEEFVSDRKKLIEIYQTASLLVVPSDWDNCPYTVLEAMACGKAVIASQCFGIPELLKHGESGILVPPRDDVRLAEAIIDLLRNAERREAIGKEARNEAELRFSLTTIGHETQEFYSRVCS